MSEARKEPNASAASSGTVITGRSPSPANRVSNSRQRRPHTLLQQRLGQDARDERRDQCERGGCDKPPHCCQRACGEFADHNPSARAVHLWPPKMFAHAQDISKSWPEPVTYVTGREGLPAQSGKKNPRGRAASDLRPISLIVATTRPGKSSKLRTTRAATTSRPATARAPSITRTHSV